MKSEMNIEIKLDQKEKLFIAQTNEILKDIRNQLDEYKENGHYPFVDSIKYPGELSELAGLVADIGRLTL